jgi:ribosomal protein L21E
MSQFDRLIARAASLPQGHPERRKILASLSERFPAPRVATHDRIAVGRDTEDFVEWVIATKMDDPMKPGEVERYLEAKLGREAERPVEGAPSSRKTGPLQEGETVKVDKNKNTNPLNTDHCELYHNRVGVVTKATPESLTVAFYDGDVDHPSTNLSGDVQLFEGTASGAKTGLYRHTPRTDYIENAVDKKVMFEIVYFKGGDKVDVTRAEDIEAYVETGALRGEHRSLNYLSGYVGKFAYSKTGELYFTFASPQRTTPTTVSPTKGKLLYLGILGKRPSGWAAEAEKLGLRIP